MFIPVPWRHYGFVRFKRERDAKRLIGTTVAAKGTRMMVKASHFTKRREEEKISRSEVC